MRDPKERLICAASFRVRVRRHALMNVCEPVLERAGIFDSYAAFADSPKKSEEFGLFSCVSDWKSTGAFLI